MVAVTILLPLLFILLGFVPPRLPVAARLGIQVVAALLIYILGSEVEFPLPVDQDEALIPLLYGGNGGAGGFSYLSLGFLCGVLGVIASVIGEVIRKLTGKKKEEAGS